MPDDRSVADSTSTWGVVNIADVTETGNPTEDMRVPSSKLPWAICARSFFLLLPCVQLIQPLAFDSGGLTISCTILFPEQFDALRRTYDCEKSMVESLARCIKWDASGGKSGSGFLKTRGQSLIAFSTSRAHRKYR
jgi:1-phosphatidylinositol-3-phosphate 5-kinase